ncbi:hypothetical protein LCGC14_2251110, partial [marine sediment metagenome]
LARVLKTPVAATGRGVSGAGQMLGLPRVTAAALNRVPSGVQRYWKSIFKATDGDYLDSVVRRIASDSNVREITPELFENARILGKQVTPRGDGTVLMPKGAAVLHGARASETISIFNTGPTGHGIQVTADIDVARANAQTASALANEPLGDVIAMNTSRDLNLIDESSDVYKKIAKDSNGVPDTINRNLQKQGFDGIWRGDSNPAVLFNGEDLIVGARILQKNLELNAKAAESILLNKPIMTRKDVLTETNAAEILAQAQLMGGNALDEDARTVLQKLAATINENNPNAHMTAEILANNDAMGTGTNVIIDALTDIIPEPKLRQFVEFITNNETDRLIAYTALAKASTAPVERGFFGRAWNVGKAALTASPAHTRQTQLALEGASMLFEYDGARIGARFTAISKLLEHNFGKGVFKDQKAAVKALGLEYRGKVPEGAEDVIDTVFFLFENIDDYAGVTPDIRNMAEAVNGIFNFDLAYSQRLGMNIEPITSMAYMPHGLNLNTRQKRNLSSVAGNVVRLGRSGAFKQRKYARVQDFAAEMRKVGLDVESDPLVLTAQRLMGAATSRRNHVYLQGVADTHGRFDPSESAQARPGETPLPLR